MDGFRLMINAKTKAGFERALKEGIINPKQIAFIKDTQEIWTQGVYYPCPYNKQQIDEFIEILSDRCTDLEARSYTLTKTDVQDTNIRDAYQLVNEKGIPQGETIRIFNDQSLKNVELVDQKLILTYILADNTESSVTINFSEFILEFEFKDGFDVINGNVYLQIDPTSESYLSVSENGIKLSGIDEAIENSWSWYEK